MRTIKILDCTLRDGGCVNNFNFGNNYMREILNGIEVAKIEVIECGYLDENSGSETDRSQYANMEAVGNFIKEKKQNSLYAVMIDYGKFSPSNLPPCGNKTADIIRLAFHKKDCKKIILWGKQIIKKGYKLFIQPMTIMRYNDRELLELISEVNSELPETSAFYIVDSFGEMRLDDLNRVSSLIDHNLNSDIVLGLHCHNNIQLSYANAIELLNFHTQRSLIFDSSITGMGKGAGNMATELFAEHLNRSYGKKYYIEALLEVIDKVINQLREKYKWGYSIEGYLTSRNSCTPSYGSHFYKKHMLSVSQVSELLSMIPENKKISFDKDFADKLYFEYNSKKYDDSATMKKLKQAFDGKRILLIAPGKSIKDNFSKINEINLMEDIVSIAINNFPSCHTDYVFISKKVSLENMPSQFDSKLIITSNVSDENSDSLIVNYSSWASKEDDTAFIIFVRILKHLGVKNLYLAGFDGFSSDIDSNYYDERIKRPMDKEQVAQKNSKMIEFLHEIKPEINYEFVTESIYQEKE